MKFSLKTSIPVTRVLKTYIRRQMVVKFPLKHDRKPVEHEVFLLDSLYDFIGITII